MPNSKRKAHCNKVAHRTLLGAQISLKRTILRAEKRGDPIATLLAAYKCPYCDNFHVGRSLMRGIDWAAVAAYDARIKRLS